MVQIIFIIFVIKGVFYDVPPDYGWKLKQNKFDKDFKAYYYTDSDKPVYYCHPIEEENEESIFIIAK